MISLLMQNSATYSLGDFEAVIEAISAGKPLGSTMLVFSINANYV